MRVTDNPYEEPVDYIGTIWGKFKPKLRRRKMRARRIEWRDCLKTGSIGIIAGYKISIISKFDINWVLDMRVGFNKLYGFNSLEQAKQKAQSLLDEFVDEITDKEAGG